MNGCERIRAALSGREADVTPVMLHNFMMAAREAGMTMETYRRDPGEMARAHIEAVERYGYDGMMVDVDTATLAGAVGVEVAFPVDDPAVVVGPRLQSLAEVADLGEPDVERYWGVQAWLECVRQLRKYFGEEIYVRGNCDQAPFALAGLMRGSADWMMEVVDPECEEQARALLEYCGRAAIQFLDLMVDAGAHMVSNGDSPAGPSVVSPRIYREFALPYEKRLAEFAHGRGVPYMLHICGKTEPILESMVETGSDGLEIDHKTSVMKAREVIAGRTVFVGNVDPSEVLARGSVESVRAATRLVIDAFAGEPRFILNAGCGIPASTPPANLKAMIEEARKR